MSIFETRNPVQPTAQRGALRVKRAVVQAFQQMESALSEVALTFDRHERAELLSALGEDRNEIVTLYKELKKLVEKYKPGTSIRDLEAVID